MKELTTSSKTIPHRLRWGQLNALRGVYVVGMAGYVKIGWSASIGKRIAGLEETVPEHMGVYRVLPKATISDERWLHRLFSQYRRKGEWFINEGRMRAFVGALSYRAEDLPTSTRAAQRLLKRDDDGRWLCRDTAGPPTLWQRCQQIMNYGEGTVIAFRPTTP